MCLLRRARRVRASDASVGCIWSPKSLALEAASLRHLCVRVPTAATPSSTMSHAHTREDIDSRLDRLSITAQQQNASRMSKQYGTGAGQRPFMPGSGAAGAASSAANRTSRIGGTNSTASSSSASSSKPLSRMAPGIANVPSSSSSHALSSSSKAGGVGVVRTAPTAPGPKGEGKALPKVDVGTYDGGLERDERKGRRTGQGSELLDVDSAATG